MFESFLILFLMGLLWKMSASHTSFLLGWNELLIASFSHRSVSVQDGILLATGLHVHRSSAHSAGVGSIFDRHVFNICSHFS